MRLPLVSIAPSQLFIPYYDEFVFDRASFTFVKGGLQLRLHCGTLFPCASHRGITSARLIINCASRALDVFRVYRLRKRGRSNFGKQTR